MRRAILRIGALIGAPIVLLLLVAHWERTEAQRAQPTIAHGGLFTSAESCIACHNGLVSSGGEDISIGSSWRGSMMAHSARDPYWQAAVRREVLEHPKSGAAIEDECSICHMPMTTFEARARGSRGRVFEHLANRGSAAAEMATEGVSCTVCHQITADGFGERRSFTGRFQIDRSTPLGQRGVFGPYPVDTGRVSVMHSASGFRPMQSEHVQRSELCATCHTLYTHARANGDPIGVEFPEQVPYLEWRHSSYAQTQSCQSCHMPEVEGLSTIASVLGLSRRGVSRHEFRGGNFFMLRMLNRYRTELGVTALPEELEAAERSTIEHLQTATASVSIERAAVDGRRLLVDVVVTNRAGHKLPTGYPSRRVWLDVQVRDRTGQTLFSSGALATDGSIAGNDNDADPSRYEPHHDVVTSGEAVQIYEAVMADARGNVTTGLLSATRYLKDNRLLPRGFDKSSAHDDIAVRGAASTDADFRDASDRVRYVVDLGGGAAPFRIDATLRYQPIAFRWAHNLRSFDAPETRRFLSFYQAMSNVSALALARDSATTR